MLLIYLKVQYMHVIAGKTQLQIYFYRFTDLRYLVLSIANPRLSAFHGFRSLSMLLR